MTRAVSPRRRGRINNGGGWLAGAWPSPGSNPRYTRARRARPGRALCCDKPPDQRMTSSLCCPLRSPPRPPPTSRVLTLFRSTRRRQCDRLSDIACTRRVFAPVAPLETPRPPPRVSCVPPSQPPYVVFRVTGLRLSIQYRAV